MPDTSQLITVSVKTMNFPGLSAADAKAYQKIDRSMTNWWVGDFQRSIYNAILQESKKLATYVVRFHMSGQASAYRGGGGSVAQRSGKLARSVTIYPTRGIGLGTVTGGVSIGKGVPYAGVQVGPAGQTTTIFPKTAKSLAIPLSSAMTGRGVVRAPYSQGNLMQFSPRLFRGRGSGKDILFIKQSRDSIIPMFVLRKSVRVPARVHPEEIVNLHGPVVQQNLVHTINQRLQRLQA